MSNNEELKLFYSREDYEQAIKDAATLNILIGSLLGGVIMFVLCLIAGYYLPG